MTGPTGMTLDLKYFAWVREKIGVSGETVELPDAVNTVSDLITWLKQKGPEYQAAFDKPDIIRVAINQKHAPTTAPLHTANEVAFFPPVTGG